MGNLFKKLPIFRRVADLVKTLQSFCLRIYSEPCCEMRCGFFKVAGAFQRLSKIVVGIAIRLKFQRALAYGDGLVEPIQAEQREAKVIVCIGMIGREFERQPVMGNRLFEPAKARQRVTQFKAGIGVIRLEV